MITTTTPQGGRGAIANTNALPSYRTNGEIWRNILEISSIIKGATLGGSFLFPLSITIFSRYILYILFAILSLAVYKEPILKLCSRNSLSIDMQILVRSS